MRSGGTLIYVTSGLQLDIYVHVYGCNVNRKAAL